MNHIVSLLLRVLRAVSLTMSATDKSKMKQKWIVIGISGVTCSGKSTLANKLYKEFPKSIVVRQDSYFLPPDDPRHVRVKELNCKNWDIITSLDMQSMHSDIVEILETYKIDANYSETGILILDGFLLFKHKAIAELCDRKYFLTLTEDECWDRRKNRIYEPPDVPGYFDKIVWPEYSEYYREVKRKNKSSKDITFIKGTNDIEDTYDRILKEINQLLLQTRS